MVVVCHLPVSIASAASIFKQNLPNQSLLNLTQKYNGNTLFTFNFQFYEKIVFTFKRVVTNSTSIVWASN